MKINKYDLRNIIQAEVKKMVDEDALLSPPMLGDPHYYDLDDKDCPDDDLSTMFDKPSLKKSPMVYSLDEGACGCQQKSLKMTDYSLDSMHDILSPGKAFDVGFAVSPHKHKHHKGSSYMARPQLAKIAKYAALLHSMIDEGEELQDWQESHIAQMADDIGEVFHSIEYKKM